MSAVVRAMGVGVAGVLLLAGCGGGGSKADDKPTTAGATQEATPKVSGSSGATAVTAAERPEMKLPSDLSYTFEWPKTGDGKKDAVLGDTEQFIKAVDLAIADQDPLDKAYRFYSEGEAAAGSRKFIQEFVDYQDRITGAKRFFDAKAKINADGTAGLVYCEDQTKAYNKSLKTGKTDVTTPSKDDYVLYSSLLRTDRQGVWITEKLTSQRGSAECRP